MNNYVLTGHNLINYQMIIPTIVFGKEYIPGILFVQNNYQESDHNPYNNPFHYYFEKLEISPGGYFFEENIHADLLLPDS